MIAKLSLDEARAWFERLPPTRRIATLSPDYVQADARRAPDLEPVFFGYREGDDIWLHGVHRSHLPDAGITDQQSPYGYGGPSTNNDDPQFSAQAWEQYVQVCRDDGVLAEFVRLHPVAAHWQRYGGTVRAERDTVLVDTTGDIRARYSVRCRTAVRKAEKSGLAVHEESVDLIASRFADHYRDGMVAIGAEAFYLFSEDYFRAMRDWPSVRLLVCAKDGIWHSAGLFLVGGTAVEYHLSATTEDGRRLGATNLLLDGAARLAAEVGRAGLYLGGGTSAAPDNPLLFFKKSFSDTILPFRIGSAIFQQDRYAALKAEHEAMGRPVSRTLFYRM